MMTKIIKKIFDKSQNKSRNIVIHIYISLILVAGLQKCSEIYLFCFGDTPSTSHGLLLALCTEITLNKLGKLGIKPG